MTHGRTLQTLKWAALLSVLVAAASGSCGCGMLKSPTSVEEPELHPNELLIIEHTQCYADWLVPFQGEIDVYFWEHRKEFDCKDRDGKDAKCVVAGEAMPLSGQVGYWGPWVRAETRWVPPDLEWSAAHEVCHLAGTWNEAEAKRCALVIWDEAGCHEAGKQPTGLDPRLVM